MSILRPVAQVVVHDNECGHRIYYRDGARENAWIVTAGGRELYGLFLSIHRILFFTYG